MSNPFDKIGIVGAGSMGGSMAMLFAENGLQVSVYDVAEQNIDSLSDRLKDPTSGLAPDLHQRVAGFKDLPQFMDSLGGKDADKLLVFSIPHGSAADKVIAQIRPHLSRGDIILDGGNEWYENAQRRQGELAPDGIAYLSMGVSGGYQSARRGPSISPSGDKGALDRVMPLLQKVAARDVKSGKPCVANLGPAGCGHYVKMVHNGIEQGILGVVNEAWELLYKCLHTDLDTIAQTFKKWEAEGELVCAVSPPWAARVRMLTVEEETELPGGHRGGYMRSTQGERGARACGERGAGQGGARRGRYGSTGIWSVMEAAKRHVSAPTIASAHFFRIASADRAQRMQVVEALGESIGAARKQHLDEKARTEFVEDLRLAVYCATLASFSQGLNLIARASADEGWNVSLAECMQIWREGCIIRSEYIADVLQPVLETSAGVMNVLTLQPLAEEIKRTVPHLRKVVQHALEWNAHIPALSASLEYFKYCAGKHLPSQFMEAELDYFGAHSYDLKSEGDGEVKKGKPRGWQKVNYLPEVLKVQ